MSAPSPTLLIAHCFPPCVQVGVHRPWRFYKYLPSYGYRPLVCTSTPQDPRNPLPDVTCLETRIRPKFSVEGFFDRILTYSVFHLELGELRWTWDCLSPLIQLHRQTGFRTVLSTSPPLSGHLAALRLKRKLGVKWIADFRDPLYGNPFRDDQMLHRWMDGVMERTIFKHADILIANTDVVLESWKRRYPGYAGKMQLLWNGFDPEEQVRARPIPPRPYRLLGHVGSIYNHRHPGIIIESLARLAASRQLAPGSVRFVQQGYMDGAFEQYANRRNELKQLGMLVENDTVTPAEARKILSEVDLLVLIDTPGERPSQVPAKLFEYVQIGRPILACTAAGSPVDRLLAECGIPNTRLYYGSPAEEIDAKLLEFLKLPSDPVPMAASFAGKFDGRLQTGQLARMLDTLTA